MNVPPQAQARMPRQILPVLVLGFITLILLRTAWVGDDAFIAFKASYNFLHGFGPNYNPGERVQVFTSPLNFWVQTALFALTDEYLVAPQIMGVLLMLAALVMLYRLVGRGVAGCMACLALLGSRAAMDYATAGLENSLAYVLMLALVYAYTHEGLRGRTAWIYTLAGLLYLCRQDLVLMGLPPALDTLLRQAKARAWKPMLGSLALGVALPLAWTGFSVFYYGYPFPNTYYSKLGGGVPFHESLAQGVLYLFDLIWYDGPTALLLVLAGVAAFRAGQRRHRVLFAGIGLYVAYVLVVGGDFMSGRFFAVPAVLAACLFFSVWQDRVAQISVAATLLIFSLMLPYPHLRTGFEVYEHPERPLPFHIVVRASGIADERMAYFYDDSMLYRMARYNQRPTTFYTRWAGPIENYRLPLWGQETAGIGPFYAGPGIFTLDLAGLGDPLLSHLPNQDPGGAWRIGHIYRTVPVGYQESIITNSNRLQDPELRTVYDDIRLATRAPLLAPDRLGAIWRLNTGRYKKMLMAKKGYASEAILQNNPELQAKLGFPPPAPPAPPAP